jgi:integrase
MKGHVSKRGSSWAYWFDIDPDPLTGKRRQQTKSGYESDKESWKACRDAIADYEKGHLVKTSRRNVGDALTEWLARIEHSIKPSMAQNWRNYAAYYVVPYIGKRAVQDIDGAVCDALFAKLLAEGRIKARAKKERTRAPVHVLRVTPDGRLLPCRPYRYDEVRCYRTHAEADPALGQPIETKKPRRRPAAGAGDAAANRLPPGLEPKTVVNTHRMLHRAWEDFVAWGWARRNVVNDAHPPRLVRKGRKVWTVAQLRIFLQRARSDRFFALWVLEATSGMRRCELAGARRDLLDPAGGTLTRISTQPVKATLSQGFAASAR